MKRVLILTAGFGDGHNAAARNVREALEQSSTEVEVTVADLYERSYKRLNSIAKKAYLNAVRYAPQLWAGFFKLVDGQKLQAACVRLSERMVSLPKGGYKIPFSVTFLP